MLTTKALGFGLGGSVLLNVALGAWLAIALARLDAATTERDSARRDAEAAEASASGLATARDKWESAATDLSTRLTACAAARDAVRESGAEAVARAREAAAAAAGELAALRRRVGAGIGPSCEACANAPMCEALQVKP